MEPNLSRALELFSQGIKQGSLFTKSGNPQNFSGGRRPFISSDPIPVNQGLTPIPPSFRPDPVSPGQLGLFDVRAKPPSSFNPSLERTGPRLSVSATRPLSTLPANYLSFPEAPPGEISSFRVMPEGNQTPMGAAEPQRYLLGSERFRAPSLPEALTGGKGSSPSVMDLLKTASYLRTGGGPLVGLTGLMGSEYLASTQRNELGGIFSPAGAAYSAAKMFTGDLSSPLPVAVSTAQQLGKFLSKPQQSPDKKLADPVEKNYIVGDIEYDYKTGRAINPPPNILVPARVSPPQYNPPGNNRPDQAPLPQNNPPGNTMTPASAAFTRFFVDDANRLTPTARELATATGGVQTRDLGSLTSGLKAADLESLLNSVASAQAIPESPSFMAGNPLMGTPKLMLTGARDQAVNEQKQQYAKQNAPKKMTDEQRDYVLTMQAQQAAGKVLLPEILKNLGYSPQDPATRDLAVWAESNPGLALAVYNKQLEQNLNNRSDFPSPRELSSSDPVNQQSASNVEGTMVNSPMGANLARNAVANSHFKADAYVSGNQLSNELADATQPLVQPTLQTAEQFIDQAPERAEATAQISDEMLKRAMELKLGKMSMNPSLLGN